MARETTHKEGGKYIRKGKGSRRVSRTWGKRKSRQKRGALPWMKSWKRVRSLMNWVTGEGRRKKLLQGRKGRGDGQFPPIGRKRESEKWGDSNPWTRKSRFKNRKKKLSVAKD